MRRLIRHKMRSCLWSSLFLIVACAIVGLAQDPSRVYLPNEAGIWDPPTDEVGRPPEDMVRIEIVRIGRFDVDPANLVTQRADVLQTGHFSVFDVVYHLGATGEIDLATHYDEAMATHVIDSIDGETGWWYEAHYDRGWFERSVQRMDHYPIKDGTFIRLFKERASRLEGIHREFAEEVTRLVENDGDVILSEVEIRGPRGERLFFEDVVVRPHGVRPDLLRPGTVTALDILLSLGEQGMLAGIGLRWYEEIAGAVPVDNYFVEEIHAPDFEAVAFRTCGFVYETGPKAFRGFSGSHIHIPTDARIIVSPEYALWFWLCL